ncbi:CDP-diacylglycerol--serine O-phosphatidyltransferase [Methylacidiphilum kamchatkense Kam1]|uniref:CDP-diacylglycerol--serine O-phosphatidyltransferase n=2 Tax=Methylacidiphilum kamchatkense TaxID=431057 RepID=A0A0C1UQ99_9BACT|nr:CDP-diacylglycerol--serine O-phosphatidyltransferase [Methylacidiphilum kamchatkense Kam1]QDQ41277.1 CDP-diacylglycerol--serine O-phosphatidyltransferase [Methylacidiphilum kamchatkense Kam1]
MAMNEWDAKKEEKIYLLPNLLTAGNLICGFLAILKILEGSILRDSDTAGWIHTYENSLNFILAAFVFDVLDGRLARFGGKESMFGREFDSLADLISFGVAPALLVFEIVLYQFPHKIGWIVASIYLVCGALRLARFNVLATQYKGSNLEFTGFPIPAAAGLVCSITLLMLYFYETDRELEKGWGKYILVVLLLFLSIMMFSKNLYPSFKGITWKTKWTVPKFLFVVSILGLTIVYYKWMLAVDFLGYLLYGFFRPFISKPLRKAIEEEGEEEEEREGEGKEEGKNNHLKIIQKKENSDRISL